MAGEASQSEAEGAPREPLGPESLLAAIATGVLALNQEGCCTYANASALRILGMSESKLVGSTADQAGIEFHYESGADASPTKSPLLQPHRDGTERLRAVVRCVRPGGHDVWLDAERVALRGPAGEWEGSVVSFVDVTESHRVEAAERVSFGRISHALDAMSTGVVIVDSQGRIEYANLASAASSGLKPEDVIGQLLADPAWQLMDETGTVLSYDALPVPTALRERREVLGVELGVPTLAGETHWMRVNAQPVFEADGALRGAVVTTEDVTERRVLAEQLLQAQKMEGIGQLAGGIAHDFNNLLTVIVGNAELALYRLRDSDVTTEIAEIRDAAEHGAALTRRLLSFVRKQVVRPKPVYLDRLAGSLATLLQRLLGEDIVLRCMSMPGLWPVKADPSQMEQILVNMAINARDAISRSGKLTLETRNVRVDAAQAQAHAGIEPGDFVLLSIADNGSGMPHELVPRIFDPFFTTKPVGSGTGLGLATCQGVVKQVRGFIAVETEIGRGTTFQIYLPRCSDDSGVRTVPHEVEQSPGSAKILLAEDQEPVRSLVARALTGYGYEVISSSNGQGALEALQRMAQPPDLLLTDLVMPGMSGVELARLVQEQLPGLPVLYISGFAEALPASAGAAVGADLLLKPFTPMQLLKRVQQILGSSVASAEREI